MKMFGSREVPCIHIEFTMRKREFVAWCFIEPGVRWLAYVEEITYEKDDEALARGQITRTYNSFDRLLLEGLPIPTKDDTSIPNDLLPQAIEKAMEHAFKSEQASDDDYLVGYLDGYEDRKANDEEKLLNYP
jgi:hypothetical protein